MRSMAADLRSGGGREGGKGGLAGCRSRRPPSMGYGRAPPLGRGSLIGAVAVAGVEPVAALRRRRRVLDGGAGLGSKWLLDSCFCRDSGG